MLRACAVLTAILDSSDTPSILTTAGPLKHVLRTQRSWATLTVKKQNKYTLSILLRIV
ncbi:MAG: hypothetical protein ACI965_001215 [Paraglaciecola sp.]|jgi:hypothetical protein